MVYRKITVGVLIRAPYIYRTKLKNNKEHYSGFLFDIWQLIAKKNNFNCVYTSINQSNYTAAMKKYGDKYDVIIGNISNGVTRYKYVNFTNPLKINKIGIMRKKKFKAISFLLKFIKSISLPLLLLVIVGIILGLILWLVDPDRTFIESEMGQQLKHGWRKPLISTVASMFGEMGGVVERTNLSILSLITVLVIMVISYFSTIYFQAMTIGDMIGFDNDSVINSKGITNVTILTLKGTSIARVVESSGAKVEYSDLKSISELLEYYKENLDKYDAMLIDYDTMLNIEENNPEFMIDPYVFGYDDLQFAVSKRNYQLLDKINNSILDLQSNLKIKEICGRYKNNDSTQCVI